ncbi:MAG TPA: HU family DNA-binding protein [Candidatus Desulfofervidus auxilii]|uniref:HU family DNA-binding protein n=1 Tax=Desulfofervidus auxilii TaxID=1621989 RepID=A0A7C0Y3I8_DESA2|nr:HU family DNA-binding protein [Candidatus Desulfofervidus auxilii]
MTKRDIVEQVHRRLGLPRLLIKEVVNATLEVIRECLIEGEEVKIVRFGKWQPVLRQSKRVKHPVSGEIVEIPPYGTVVFKPSRDLEKL